MSDLLTRCNWCKAGQEGNLTDTCTNCKAEGYLMDYRGGCTMNLFTCENCKADLEDDDIVWANDRGQLSEGFNNFAWCVPCLPAQETLCGDHLVMIKDCGCRP